MGKLFIFLFSLLWSVSSFAVLNNPPKASDYAYFPHQNKLKNPGAELGKVDWTASGGTFTIETTAANVFEGARSFSWNPSAGSQTFRSGTYALPAYMTGYAVCYIQTAATDMNFTVEDNSAAEQATFDVQAIQNSEFKQAFVTFSTGDGSATYRISIESASDSAVAKIDSCKLGVVKADEPFSNVSQATFVGSAYIAGTLNCQWTRTNTALGAFGTDTDCPGPTVETNPGPGTIQTTDTDLPKFTVNDLPAGRYEVVITGFGGNSAGGGANFAINDGTTTSGLGNGNSTSGAGAQWTAIGYFTYTASGNRSFEVYGAAVPNTVNLFNAVTTYKVSFFIKRFPLESQIAYTQDQANYGWTSYTPTFTGFGTATNIDFKHKRVGSDLHIKGRFTTGTVTAVEPRISLPGSLTSASSSVLPATLAPAGWVNPNSSSATFFGISVLIEPSTAYVVFGKQASTTGSATKVADTTTTFVNSTLYFVDAVIPIAGWVETNVPALLGSVITQENVSPYRVLTAKVSSADAVSDESGDWINGDCTNATAGRATCNFNSGVFSVAPTCSCIPIVSAVATCGLDAAATTSAITVITTNGSAGTNTAFHLTCIGPK